MEENELLDNNIFNDKSLKDKKPNGLKSLSIWTYVGSAILILVNVFAYSKLDLSYFNDKQKFELLFYNTLPYIISVVMSILGAYQMIKRKRIGFYIHAVGNLIFIAVHVHRIINYLEFTQYSLQQSNRLFSNQVYGPIIMIAVSLLFIYLYSRHRKYLN